MAEMNVRLANCLLDEGLSATICGLGVTIEQLPDAMPWRHQELRGQQRHTTTIHLEKVDPSEYDRAKEVADNIVWLLRFATLSRVEVIDFAFAKHSEGRTVTSTARRFSPSLRLSRSDLESFLSQVFSSFEALKDSRRLHHAFDYMVLSEAHGIHLEVRCLLLFVALELLKSTHSPNQRRNFYGRVNRMLREVGMKKLPKDLRNLRDDLVHDGIAPACPPYDKLAEQHGRLHDLLREYVLRALGYRGDFPLYTGRGLQVRTI